MEDEGNQYNWDELVGMSENKAEDYMIQNWGEIPQKWFDPIFRDEVLDSIGQAEHEAHMNFGMLAYGREDRLGDDAAAVWERRNIDGQGHPATEAWKKRRLGRE